MNLCAKTNICASIQIHCSLTVLYSETLPKRKATSTDISFFLGEFEIQNSNLNFLNNLSSKEEIENWVNKLTSKIVLKFNEDEIQLSDFIFYTLNP